MDDVDDTDTPLVGRTLPFPDEKPAAGLGWAAAPLADTGVLRFSAIKPHGGHR